MTVKYSIGLHKYVAQTGSIQSALANGTLYFYKGAPPATAETSIDTGVSPLLATVTCVAQASGAGGGLYLVADTYSGYDVLVKNPAHGWIGTVSLADNIGFFRLVEAGDTPHAYSLTAKRIQGQCATDTSQDLQLETLLTALNLNPIVTSFRITM